jgi:hypothetical protein
VSSKLVLAFLEFGGGALEQSFVKDFQITGYTRHIMRWDEYYASRWAL